MTEIVLDPTAPTSPMASTAPPAPSLADGARKKTHYKTIVVSDTHMGDPAALAAFLLEFFRHNSCDRLILNGDIIDGWEMMRKKSRPFTEMEARVWDAINHLSLQGAEVIYIRGNHDEEITLKKHGFVGKTPHEFKDPESGRSAKILFKRCHIFKDSRGRSVFALHGDTLDKDLKFLVEHFLGKSIDGLIEDIDALNAELRKLLSGKGRIRRSALKSVRNVIFEYLERKHKLSKELVNHWKNKDFDIVLMGHVHIPSQKTYDRPHSKTGKNHKIKVINSGDWVENCTFIAETEDGKWHLKHFDKQLKRKDIEVLPSEDAPNEYAGMRGVTVKELNKFQEIWPGKGIDKLSGQFAKHAHRYANYLNGYYNISCMNAFSDAVGKKKNEEKLHVLLKLCHRTHLELFSIAKRLFPVEIDFNKEFEKSIYLGLMEEFNAAHFNDGKSTKKDVTLEKYLKMMKKVYMEQYERLSRAPQAA